MKMPACTATLLALAFVAGNVDAITYPSVENFPAPAGYDNLGGAGTIAGQTFVAAGRDFLGVRLVVGPDDNPDSIGPLAGPADLVLYDADDLEMPIELARQEIVAAGDEVVGEQDFMLTTQVSTEVGRKYFWGIDTLDLHGLGNPPNDFPDYTGGRQAFLTAGVLSEGMSGRDLCFIVYSSTHLIYPSINNLSFFGNFDNVGENAIGGQTFIATADSFIGARVITGLPENVPSIGPLDGPADLVLFVAADLQNPVEIARHPILGSGVSASGQRDFFFPQSVPTQIGQRYFFGLDPEGQIDQDLYGLGLAGEVNQSTYPDAASSGVLLDGTIHQHSAGRDLVFLVYSTFGGEIFLDGFESGNTAAWSSMDP